MEALFFEAPAAMRVWSVANHAIVTEAWVGLRKRSSGLPSITWPEAVDQALAFGWIDGVRQSINATSYRIRFSPRRPRSIWSQVNIRRFAELDAAALIAPTGRLAFEAGRSRSERYSYENEARTLDSGELRRFLAAPDAHAWFEVQPPSYRKQVLWWVGIAKKPETKRRRLDQLIQACREQRRLLR